MQVASSHNAQEWLESPLGEALLQQEARVVEEALDGIFGEECLQLGIWGERRTFTRFTRTQRCAVIAETPDGRPSAIGDFHRLPVESDSIDAMLLPHTLDYSDRPHEILRKGICFVPQERALFGKMTVRENLRMGGFILRDKQELERRIDEVLEHALGLAD